MAGLKDKATFTRGPGLMVDRCCSWLIYFMIYIAQKKFINLLATNLKDVHVPDAEQHD